MGWTLDQVRDLDFDEWTALVAWVEQKANRQTDSMDADELVKAMDAKTATNGPD